MVARSPSSADDTAPGVSQPDASLQGTSSPWMTAARVSPWVPFFLQLFEWATRPLASVNRDSSFWIRRRKLITHHSPFLNVAAASMLPWRVTYGSFPAADCLIVPVGL